jgi:hypothetical protein
MGDQLLPLSLTERSVHLCVDMQRIFFCRRSLADAMDGQGLAGRGALTARDRHRIWQAFPETLSESNSFRRPARVLGAQQSV